MPILQVQRRMMELGRVRLGEKGSKGEPRKLDHFRFTTASKALAEALAEAYGGKAVPWEGAPDEGYWEVKTEATQLDIVLPPVFSDADGSPTLPFSQWLELWSGGGCQRRCDGATEALTGKPCLCQTLVDAKGEDARECKPTTRLSFMLPNIPGLGVWRVESKGWNAAAELPGTLMVLQQAAQEGKFIPAVLRLEHRTKKVEGQTRRFVVPVIELPNVTIAQLASGDVPLAINGPQAPAEKPALPAAAVEPQDKPFENEKAAEWGSQPAIGNFNDAIPAAAREMAELETELLNLAEGLDVRDVTETKIAESRDKREAPEHITWLKGQITRAENKLKEGAPA